MDRRKGPQGSAREVFQTNFAFGRAVRLRAQDVDPGYWQSAHPDEDGYRPDQIMRYSEGNLNRLQIAGELHVKSGDVLYLLIEDRGAVRTLTMNRPEKRNALNNALTEALLEGLRAADADDAVNVIVLTGAGPSFCAANSTYATS